jgi:hypothetical protein
VNSVIPPDGVIRPMAGPSLNHVFPSGPPPISNGAEVGGSPVWNSVIVGVIAGAGAAAAAPRQIVATRASPIRFTTRR